MNRWAIVEGWYWYCVHFHGGQWSYLYKRMCKISTYYKPGMLHDGPSNEESKDVYLNLCADMPYCNIASR